MVDDLGAWTRGEPPSGGGEGPPRHHGRFGGAQHLALCHHCRSGGDHRPLPRTAARANRSTAHATGRTRGGARLAQGPRRVAGGWLGQSPAGQGLPGPSPGAPPFIGTPRNFCNARSGPIRVCASGTLPFYDFRELAKATGTTINGVLHAVIAGAMRRQLQRRGGDLHSPTVAIFGIAEDPDSDRRWGNRISPTTVKMHSELADPLRRLEMTALSCRQGVALRRQTGIEMAGRWTEATCRLGPMFQRTFVYRWPKIVNHVTTANVAGPGQRRWIGNLEVVDWISFAVTVAPSNCNVTVYSYAGSMCIGMVTPPEVMEDPHQFLEDMEAALDELRGAVPPAGIPVVAADS